MKATAILRNLTEDHFYQELALYSPLDKWRKINRLQRDLPHCISIKIGNDSFRDKVDLNSLLRKDVSVKFKIEPRRGYKLATFEFEQKR